MQFFELLESPENGVAFLSVDSDALVDVVAVRVFFAHLNAVDAYAKIGMRHNRLGVAVFSATVKVRFRKAFCVDGRTDGVEAHWRVVVLAVDHRLQIIVEDIATVDQRHAHGHA